MYSTINNAAVGTKSAVGESVGESVEESKESKESAAQQSATRDGAKEEPIAETAETKETKETKETAEMLRETRLSELLASQKRFFAKGGTLDACCRIATLKRLYKEIKERESELCAALKADLGKPPFESYLCEIGLALSEISYQIKHLKNFSREKRVKTPLSQFAAKTFVKKSPYGCVLIVSPWNYPFLLSIEPLADALAAGNTAILKPSAYSPNVSRVLEKMLSRIFPPEYVAVATGGRAENKTLFGMKFDKIFFTGSKDAGKDVLRAAAENLVPVALELGGKSPCIVDETADIALAAKRIAFGKFLNLGQTCVAPDYVYVAESVKEKFISALKKEIAEQYGETPLRNESYGKIVNRRHFDRICALIDPLKTVYGGDRVESTLQIEPTVLSGVTWDDPVMKEEIFGPVLPVLSYTDLWEAVEEINARPAPLALYLFSSDKKRAKNILSGCKFGGGCINDTVIHLASPYAGFGGVGESGMGGYHGKTGFDCFTHEKTIVDKKTFIDLPMRYRPYKKTNEKFIRFFLK